MINFRRYNIRLEDSVAEQYEEIALQKGIPPSVMFRDILTNHFQTITFKTQVDRVEQIVNQLENKVENFVESNSHNERFYEDFSTSYLMLLWLLMKSNASKDEIRSMQRKGEAYAEQHFIGNDE